MNLKCIIGMTLALCAGGAALAATYKEVSVLEFGAKGDGIADDTRAIQTAIDQGNSVYFPPGTYRVTQLQFYWGDANFDPMFQYRGNKAKIVGTPGTKREYLIDVAGQDMLFSGLEFLGLGEFDTTYDTLLRMHTRAGKVSIDKVYFQNCVFRANNKALLIGIPADSQTAVFAKISEFFFDSCWFGHCQKIMENRGGRFVDAIFNSCHINPVMPKKIKIDLEDNYIVKMNCGTARFNGCNFMQTSCNDNGDGAGWAIIFADKNAYSTTVRIDSSTLELKRGVKWHDGSAGELHINGNTNGFYGYKSVKEPLFSVGKNCTGLISMNSFFCRRDQNHGPSPLFVDAVNSPDFKILIGDTSNFSRMDGVAESLQTRILGGLYNFPDSVIALLYGNVPVVVPANSSKMIEFAKDVNTSDYPSNRFDNLYHNGWITIPNEGLEDAWLEVLTDWDQSTGTAAVIRETTLPCELAKNSKQVKVVPGSGEFTANEAGNLFYRGIAPGATVDGIGVPGGAKVDAGAFGKNAFELTAPADKNGIQLLSFGMKVAPVSKGALQRIYLGTLQPGDKIGIQLTAQHATVKTTADSQRLKLTGRSGLISQRTVIGAFK